ncbi:MAG TPA: glycosyltransferase [Candidatus Limnocylindrales bacterium]|nr:glycosyltransferase [Candidatus Limnocylindrales bacterium]
MESPIVDVLVPTAGSAVSLGATLASLAGQRYPAFRVSALAPNSGPADEAHLGALAAVLAARGHAVRLTDADPGTPGARRQALLDLADAPFALVVDDGVFLEPDLMGRLVAAIRSAGCGFVGSAVVDLRFRGEHRVEEQGIEFWDGPVRPEEIRPGTRGWDRRRLHRGANLEHLRERLPRTRDRLYRVADVPGCVLYDTAKLMGVGGFAFGRDRHRDAPQPMGAESAAQLRLIARHGGAGLFPSGAYRLAPTPPAGTRSPAAAAALSASPRPAAAGRPARRRTRHAVASHLASLRVRARRRHAANHVTEGRPRRPDSRGVHP